MADIYVSTRGSDSGNGSASSPFRSIQKAASVATAGTTVHVAPGTYAENVSHSYNGTASAPIKFVSDTPGGAIIKPVGATGSIVSTRGDYVTIEGFEIDGSSSPNARVGIVMGGSNTYVRNNEVHHLVQNGANDSQGGAGIVLGGGYYGEINQHAIGNEVHHIATASSDRVHGIYVQSTGSVVNNMVYASPGTIGVVLWHDARNVTIANNTIFDNGLGISVGAGDFNQGAYPADNVKVVNNIVYDNRGSGIQEHGLTGTHNVYQNNLVYQNGTNWDLQNGLTHTGTVTADPQFLNYQRGGTGDYHLKATSPAINKGTTANAPTTDIDGDARIGGPDIGAQEYIAGGGGTPGGGTANTLPVVTVADHSLAAKASVAVTIWLAATDANGDKIAQYQFYDNGTAAGSGYFSSSANAKYAANTMITINAADLASVRVHAGDAAGTDKMWVRAFDGKEWGSWDDFTLTTTPTPTPTPPPTPNTAPAVRIDDHSVAAKAATPVTNWLTATDANGDAITQYQFYDNGTGADSGYFSSSANAKYAANTMITVNAADLASVRVHGGDAAGTDKMWVRAFDGKAWGSWDDFTLTTAQAQAPAPAQAAPVVRIDDHSLATKAATPVTNWLTATDANGDAITQYQFYDNGTAASSGYFSSSANAKYAATTMITVNAADLASVRVHGGDAAGTDKMWVRAFDGKEWGAWDDFILTTQSQPAGQQTPPVVRIDDHTVSAKSAAPVTNWLTATDANGDAITQYEFYDNGTAANSGYFSSGSNAHHAANTMITVNPADLASVNVHGGDAAGTDKMWVRAHDGTAWGQWDQFMLTTVV
jgi:hypothetical protein